MTTNKQESPLQFAAWFVGLFVVFYYANIFFFGITSPGKFYSPFLAEHLNYIQWLRWALLKSSAFILNCLGYTTLTNNFELLVSGKGIIQLVYSCLGLGVISFFAAFVLAYPKPSRAKIIFLLSGVVVIELLNIARFVLLALFWTRQQNAIDHHTIFNILMYLLISASLYFWVKTDITEHKQHG